ncbi:MAG: sodium:alanine symporter family protein, partial [Firmicutes bacterium]|nr:sodium:alanine symporter family protein [Bacillota bacterium]
MLDIIYEINGVVNGFVWGLPIIFLILFTGIFYSIRLGFPQFRNIGFLFWSTVKKAFSKKDEDDKKPGEISSFQAAMISVSAIVGSGNIAGVATAIVLGGPGAVFWMIIAAII